MPPILRVMTAEYRHQYHRMLYASLAEQVTIVPFPKGSSADDAEFRARLAQADIFHVHWPEWMLGPSIEQHLRLIEAIEERGIRIVWTQHNLLPHSAEPAWRPIYQCWADAADGVIHHSEWGRRRAVAFRSFRADALHRTIPHGHWGALIGEPVALDRRALAAAYGLSGERMHLGIIGAPRPAKETPEVIEGFIASGRDDLDMVVFSLGEGETAPRHPHVRAIPYENVSREEYNRRLALIDVLVLPYRSDGHMLTTGLVGDVIGAAKPALITKWPYLTEILGGAGIVYGNDADGFAARVGRLEPVEVAEAADVARKLQQTYTWEAAAAATLELLRALSSKS